MNQKGFTSIFFFLIILITVTGIVGGSLAIKKYYPSIIGHNSPSEIQSSPGVSVLPNLQPTTVPSVNSTLSPAQNINWKTYTSNNAKFSVQYPPDWIIQENGKDCRNLSDISNPQMLAPNILKNGHNWVNICVRPDDMPSTFPYSQSGTDKTQNTTIQPYSINGYSGIRGKTIFYEPGLEGEEVLLTNPLGGYVEFGLRVGSIQIFDKMMSTFKFIDKNHGQIKIVQGNLYFLREGKQQLLANKNDFTDSSYPAPIEFTDALLSPDQSKVLLIAQGGITSELLFFTDLNNILFKYIHPVSQAVWSHNSRFIAYTSHIADAGGDYYLGVYDTNLNKNIDLSKQSSIQGFPNYSISGWQEDDSGIQVHYVAQAEPPYGKIIGEGDIVIPLTISAIQH